MVDARLRYRPGSAPTEGETGSSVAETRRKASQSQRQEIHFYFICICKNKKTDRKKDEMMREIYFFFFYSIPMAVNWFRGWGEVGHKCLIIPQEKPKLCPV